MNRVGEPGDILSGELFARVAEATSQLDPPLTAEGILRTITLAIEEYSAGTGMPELAERIGKNRIPEIIGGLILLEPLNSEIITLWQQGVDREIQITNKLPRKTKKALRKKAEGKTLGQRELARLQALRERDLNEG